jgi:hypothetical protein
MGINNAPEVSLWLQVAHDEFVADLNSGDSIPIWCPTGVTPNDSQGILTQAEFDKIGFFYTPLWALESTGTFVNGNNLLSATSSIGRNFSVDATTGVVSAELAVFDTNYGAGGAVTANYIPCELVGSVRTAMPNGVYVKFNAGRDFLLGNFPVNYPVFRDTLVAAFDARMESADPDISTYWFTDKSSYINSVIKPMFDSAKDLEDCVSQYFGLSMSNQNKSSHMWLPAKATSTSPLVRGSKWQLAHYKVGMSMSLGYYASGVNDLTNESTAQASASSGHALEGMWGGVDTTDPFVSKLVQQCFAPFQDDVYETQLHLPSLIVSAGAGQGITKHAFFGHNDEDTTAFNASPYSNATVNGSGQMVDADGNPLATNPNVKAILTPRFQGITGGQCYSELFRDTYEALKDAIHDAILADN